MNEVTLYHGELSPAELTAFEEKYLSTMQTLSKVTIQKKALEDAEKKAKGILEKMMDEYGIKSIDNKYLKITRVDGTADSVTVDVDKMQKEEPDLYEELLRDYPKTVKGRKGSVRFTVKKG